MAKALEGIRVLDLTQFEAGPSCTEYLAFLGADVIKVEAPGKGDQMRRGLLDKEGREKGYDSWPFVFLNANKSSITLNLKSQKGVDVFKEMVKKADVVVSNFAPGTMDRMGIGYGVLSKVNPALVYAENSGFGNGGPYSNYTAFDQIAKAVGGAFSNTGLPDGPLINPGPIIGDTGSGVHMAVGVLAALRYRDKTGQGQEVDMAMTDNVVNQNRSPIAIGLSTGEPAPRAGSGFPGITPCNIFKCKGDKLTDSVYVIGFQPHHYEALMKIVGREDLVGELRNDLEARWEKREAVKEAIEAWTKTKDKMEAFHTLARAGIPTAPILDTLELLEDPHLNQRGMIIEMKHPQRGTFKMPGCPVKLSKSIPEYTPSPLLGQHNEEVYAEWMGYSKEDLARLEEEKVI